MASVLFNSFKSKIMDGSIDLDTDTIKCMLVTSSYSPNIDTHIFKSSVTNEIAAGNGYTAGGATLGSKVVSTDTSGDKGVFDAADVTWSASTITARGAVLYKSTGTDSDSALIAYIDFGADKSSSNGDFTIQWNASGIINLS